MAKKLQESERKSSLQELGDGKKSHQSINRSKGAPGTYKKTRFGSNKLFSKSLTSSIPAEKSNKSYSVMKKSISSDELVKMDKSKSLPFQVLSNSSESSTMISHVEETASLKPKMIDESLMYLTEPDSTLAIKQTSEVIQQHLQFLFQDKKLCDVILKNNEKQYKIHSFVLTMHSEMYKALFTGAVGTVPTEIPLYSVSCEIIEQVLEYMYTFSIKLNENDIDSVLDLSEKLDMKLLSKKCVEYMLRFDNSNVLKYLMISKKHDLTGLFAMYLEFAKRNFNQIATLPDFQNLNFDIVNAIITQDEAMPKTMDNLQIFCAVLDWAKADSARQGCLSRLFEKVLFDRIKPKDISESIESSKSILEIPKCLHILRKAFRYHAITSKMAIGPHSIKPTDVCGHQIWIDELESGIFVIGGLVDGPQPYSQGVKVFHYELPKDGGKTMAEKWTEKAPLPSRRCGHCVVILNSQMYVIGGAIHEGDALLPMPTSSMLRYNQMLKKWDTMASMSYSRSEFAACVANSFIYVFGGETDAFCPTDTVEYYCPSKDCWSLACSMPVGRSSHAASMHKGNVTVVGGCIENVILDVIDVYNIKDNVWLPRRCFPVRICRGSLSAARGRLFYFGGATFQDEMILASSEAIYEYNDSEDQWNIVGRMKFPRHLGAAVSFDQTICFIGGFSTCIWTSTAQVTCFDVLSGQFKDEIPDLPCPLMNLGAVAVQ